MHIGSLKPVLMVLVMALTGSQVYAQNKSRGYFNDEERFFYGGLAIGANFSTVDGDTYGGYHKAGLNAGGLVYVKLFKKLLASVEILYTQKGSRAVRVYESYYTGTAIEKYGISLNYAEVPLSFHYILSDKWHIGLGASYAQLISSKEEIFTDQPVYIDPAKHQFRKKDMNYILGATWQIGDGLFLDGKYQYSISSIRDSDKIPVGFGYGAQYNNHFTLRLMYLIK